MSSDTKTTPRAWTPEEDEILKRHYLEKTRVEIAALLGRTKASVRKRCSVLGLNHKHPAVTNDELNLIRQWYTAPEHATDGEFGLDELAQQLGRTRQLISRLAGKMGLTDYHRPIGEELKLKMWREGENYCIENDRFSWKPGKHPRGMSGKHHSDKFKREQSARVKARVFTPEQLEIRRQKQIATKVAKYGTGNPGWLQASNPYSRTRSGKRADLGGQFFRSSWEANYARYLNWRINQGEIVSWEFEAKTFVFEEIRQGVISYTPDFKVIQNNGTHEWHEVKGWMDAKSKIRIARMAEYYPDETLIVIDSKAYRSIAKRMQDLPYWEKEKVDK